VCERESSTESDEAYNSLFNYIRSDIIPNKMIVLITSLTAKLNSFLKSEEISDSMKKNIRRRLEREFKDSLHIFPDEKGRLLMVPHNITLQDMVLENQSLQRELLLHAVHAAKEYEAVVICSEDKDVFIMCMAFHDKIEASLFTRCGTKTRRKLVDIQKVAATIGIEVCKARIGMHAYTGCDTVSAFAGKGKVRAHKLLMKNKNTKALF